MAMACYLMNRSPSLTLVDKTLMESWSSKKPSLTYIRVFDYEAYDYVPNIKISKLEKKDVKCIFIGYDIGVKGYKLWNHVTVKVVYKKSVIFQELKPCSIDLQLEKKE
jgi:hypothetical protein